MARREWTHAQLVERAGRWLLNTKRCKMVMLEPKPRSCHERPDVIGWRPTGESFLVECKTSYSDYLADGRKEWRRWSEGMGLFRYYLSPPNVLPTLEKPCHRIAGPVCDGIGILEVHGRVVRVVREAEPRERWDHSQELAVLLAMLAPDGRRLIGQGRNDRPVEPDAITVVVPPMADDELKRLMANEGTE